MSSKFLVRCDAVDAAFARAVAAGAEVVVPLTNQFYGHRDGRLRDPFGHEWLLSQKVEEVSPEEMRRRRNAAVLRKPEANG